MGHESCGAVAAALDGVEAGPNIAHLLEQIAPAIDAAPERSVDAVVHSNARAAADRLSSASEIIGGAVGSGDVHIVPAYYALSTGAVTFADA